ncbi:MAG: hypothetical protein ING73_15685 [Rhodocyclaceae bacterium]|nr:hypothetical protein [Rhodocyclaceae bacterium]MCA3036422.1 hypothetical protein [Rhodocyclaceae bacterium]MCA3059332.1 hypothetical protein [Rhodocyclaceae bacterium]MCA3068349.1 hypothetical protein [Rhodocyclaceae bacterium]
MTFPTIGPKFILDSPLTVNATSSSGLAVTITTNSPTFCSVSGNTVTLLAPGNCYLYANQAGNTAYNSSQVSQLVVVSKTNQTISFAAIATQSLAAPTLSLSATATSALAVTFSSATPVICTVSGTTATLIAVGSCTIRANQAGNTAYNAATQVSQSFSVVKANQTITFGAIASQPFGTPISLTGSASSGLALTYTSTTASICTVSGSTVTTVAIGTCAINANQAGNTAYNAAVQVSQSFAIVKADQIITFTPVGSQPLNATPSLAATASSGLAVAFTSATPSICTVSGSTATLLTVGACTINANQVGNASVNAAPTVSQSFSVTAGTQTITGFAPASPTAYRPSGTFSLSATGGASGNPVTFASTSPAICTVSGSTAAIVTVGVCTLTANQSGTTNYNAAAEVTASVTITQATQSISVNYPNSGLTVGGTVQITAIGGGSPNLVTFASASPTICTIGASSAGPNSTSVASLSILANGGCQLTANQAGDTQYLPAPEASLTLTIGATAQIYYIHADHLGTPRTITNSVGNGKVWEWKNDDPFGSNAPDENPSGIAGLFKYNLRLPGQYYDQETGTYYNYFRDYDPATGRYVQSDPIGLAGGVNTYGYVGGSPLNSIDPYGLVRWGEVATNGLGVLGAGAGFLVGGALVAAPTGVSQVVGGLVLGKSVYSWGTSWYGLARAFSDDDRLDVPSRFQTLPRALASAFTCSPKGERVADAAELALDFASGRVVAGMVRNPSGYLRSPVGYPPINSNQFSHAANFGRYAPKDVVRFTELMQGTQTTQYTIEAAK